MDAKYTLNLLHEKPVRKTRFLMHNRGISYGKGLNQRPQEQLLLPRPRRHPDHTLARTISA